MIHFTSDLHINHANVIKYSQRPYSSVEEMNEAIVNEWNRVVKPTDTVYNLGDFAFMPYEAFKKILYRFNGIIHLILGNHDKMIIQHREDLLKQGKIRSIQHYLELKTEGQFIVLFHFALRTWNRKHYDSIHLFGHSHNALDPFDRSVDVGVDSTQITSEYRPVSMPEVLAYMSKRTNGTTDRHVED
jgi:calcineurin-like phosphoesterase family protein